MIINTYFLALFHAITHKGLLSFFKDVICFLSPQNRSFSSVRSVSPHIYFPRQFVELADCETVACRPQSYLQSRFVALIHS